MRAEPCICWADRGQRHLTFQIAPPLGQPGQPPGRIGGGKPFSQGTAVSVHARPSPTPAAPSIRCHAASALEHASGNAMLAKEFFLIGRIMGPILKGPVQNKL